MGSFCVTFPPLGVRRLRITQKGINNKMNTKGEKELYKDMLKLAEKRFSADIFVWGEELIDKKLIVYPKKLHDISGYKDVEKYLASCAIILIDMEKEDCLNGIYCMIDMNSGNIYISESAFNGAWEMLKKSVKTGIRIALKNGGSPISEPEDILIFDHLMRTGSAPILEKDRIKYIQKELTKEERFRNSRKQSLIDNPRMLYFYADGGRYFHDKECEEIKYILPEQFRASDMIPDKEMCPKCRRMICLRKACFPNTKQIPFCNKILTEHKIKDWKLQYFVMDAGLKFHAETLDEMQVTGREDKWIVKGLRNGKLELWHNNYVRTGPADRYITEGYHIQILEAQTLLQILYYIQNYSFAKHLEHEQQPECEVNQNSDNTSDKEIISDKENTSEKPDGFAEPPETAAWYIQGWRLLKKFFQIFTNRNT